MVNGTFYPESVPSNDPYTPIAMTDRDASGKDFQAFLADYTINTFLYSAFAAKAPLDITKVIKKYTNYTVTTDILGKAIPKIVQQYGSGVAVDLIINLAQAAPKFAFSTAGANAQGSLVFTININGGAAIVAEFDLASIAATANINNGKLFGSIPSWTLGSVSIQQNALTVLLMLNSLVNLSSSSALLLPMLTTCSLLELLSQQS
jgi:hypothetical protein